MTIHRFGPVNLFWSTRYDKAMTLFLACLKDFAEFANSKDKENNIPQEKCFKLPYKWFFFNISSIKYSHYMFNCNFWYLDTPFVHRIENDKVESYSITQSFNKQENWTKALKYTLNNLKWALYWFDDNTKSIEDWHQLYRAKPVWSFSIIYIILKFIIQW